MGVILPPLGEEEGGTKDNSRTVEQNKEREERVGKVRRDMRPEGKEYRSQEVKRLLGDEVGGEDE